MTDDPFFTEEIQKTITLPSNCKHLVPGRGSRAPKICFIGEAAGPDENEQGLPFVGRSGQLLDAWIAYWDLQPNDFAILNICKYWPRDEAGKTRAPTPAEIDAQRGILIKQLQALNPKICVALGAVAKNELTDDTRGQLEMSGKTTPLRAAYGLNIPVLVLPHPSYYLRHGYTPAKPGFDRYIKMAFQVIHELLGKEKLLIVDIETTGLDIERDDIRFCGFYSFPNQEFVITSDLKEMQQIIDEHTHIIGYNVREYDLPMLRNRCEVNSYGKVVIDLYQGIKARGRKEAMKLDKLPRYTLGELVRHLKLGEKKELDYNLLKKPMFTEEERALIFNYLKNDLKITKALYLWWANWAEPFRQYVSPAVQWRKSYMTCSVASYAYKAICHAASLPEAYPPHKDEEEEKEEEETFEGGFVSADVEMVKENIVELDFSSMYPHNYFQTNLFSPVTPDYTGSVFKANEFYPELQGVYRTDTMGIVEKTLQNFYLMRQAYKTTKDPRENALKLVLNSAYGASSSEVFISLHNPTIGPDTTYLGRTNIKYTRRRFEEEGYRLIYSDTDSVYIQLPPGKTLEDVHILRKKIAKEIQQYVPFPADTFEIGFKNQIKYFQCFRNKKTKKLLKKFYLYVAKNNELTLKGLPVVKSNSTQLGKRVYERLKPMIIANLDCKFHRKTIENMIREEAEKDPTSAAKCFSVRESGKYKNPNQLDCQIARRYGAGKIWLVKNYVTGVGKDVKFCTLDEAKNLKYEQLDLSNTNEELSYFIRADSLDDFDKEAEK